MGRVTGDAERTKACSHRNGLDCMDEAPRNIKAFMPSSPLIQSFRRCSLFPKDKTLCVFAP